MYGPQAAFIAELFGTRLRYSGASMGYQMAGVVGGALAPIIARQAVRPCTAPRPRSPIYVVVALALTAVGPGHRAGDP